MWEIVDRADAQSVVHAGRFQGLTLHQLWTARRAEIFGPAYDALGGRFPLLVKILDARERLSLQVHPPATLAAALGGEPKTEMWYFLDCMPDAAVCAGLRRGVTRAAFEEALRRGEVERVLHWIPVHDGESIFIPSGRLHAIGEGCLIIEVQQNSDTTYRVFDWNRMGLDGNPRTLHVEESLASIDFQDFEPALSDTSSGIVSACEHFLVERWDLGQPLPALDRETFAIFAVISGQVACGNAVFDAGAFFLVPASFTAARVAPVGAPASVLRISLPLPRRG
jgi:mannose-6-phosphate isomerase